jgi:F0F1-type ATP synthase assembly protein I
MILSMPNTNSQRNDAGGGYTRFLSLGFTLLAIIGGLTVVGFFVDRWLGTLPLFLLVGLVVGFVAGLGYVYRALKSLEGR